MLCSIDVGTSGVRLSVYSEDLRLKSRYWDNIGLLYDGGRVEQDSLKLLEAIRSMLGKASGSGCRVVGFSLYRGSAVAWRGGSASRVVTWMDMRGVEEYSRLPLYAKLASRLPGVGKAIKPGSPSLLMRSLARSYPGFRVWGLDAFLLDALTGEFSSDPGHACLTGLYNPYTLKPLRLVKRILGLEIELPGLRLHDEPPSRVEGMLVGPMAADQQAASIGLGCLRPPCMKATLGTGMFLDYPLDGRPPLLSGDLVPVVNLAAGEVLYGLEGFAAGVGMVYDAFSRVLGGFDKIEEEARKPVEPAPVIPVLAGLRTPYRPLLRGAVLGVSPGFTRASLARGLVAGTILTFLAIYRSLVEAAGEPGELRLGGGLSRLSVLAGGIAGSLGVKVYRSLDYNDSARGAALLAAYSAGMVSMRDLLNPPVELEEVEPLDGWPSGEDVERWMALVDAVSSRSFWRALEGIRRSRS